MKCSVWCTAMAVLCSTMVVHAQSADRYQIIINEIMADPSPANGLPEAEFIELYNVSPHPFTINGYKISDGVSTATINSSFVLAANSYVIVCSNGSVNQLAAFGPTLGVSNFPSLQNETDTIRLISKEGIHLHSVVYKKAWYQNVLKQEGGWSLELKVPTQACISEGNWTASNDLNGGTPGRVNSVIEAPSTPIPPHLLKAFAPGDQSIQLYFSESLDSIDAGNFNKYGLTPGNSVPIAARCLPPLFNTVLLEFSAPLQAENIYTIRVNNIQNCAGVASAITETKVAIATIPSYHELIINEVLFNPVTGNTDYIELYNNSKKSFNAKEMYIASKTANGNLGTPKPVSIENTLLFPGLYYLIAEDKNAVGKQYLLKHPENSFDMNEMPSLPDDKGNITLLNKNGAIVDALAYEDSWHFALLNNKEGVALERIDAADSTQKKENWHSASSSSGYGTPTYKNSQHRTGQMGTEQVLLEPGIFSPDNDGRDDMLQIQYRFEQPGLVCHITIFDMGGRSVRKLVNNALCGISGWFKWDGLGENAQPLPVGIYIVVAEVFNKNGEVQKIKKSVTLARRK